MMLWLLLLAAVFIMFCAAATLLSGFPGMRYSQSASAAQEINGGKVNINTAGVYKLSELPGVGEMLAQRIVDYRSRYGRFSGIEDIMLVSGIGSLRFESIREQITV